MNNTEQFLIGATLLTLLMAVQLTLSERKWRLYVPGQLTAGILIGLFILWIMRLRP
jgi:hypothetical protein